MASESRSASAAHEADEEGVKTPAAPKRHSLARLTLHTAPNNDALNTEGLKGGAKTALKEPIKAIIGLVIPGKEEKLLSYIETYAARREALALAKANAQTNNTGTGTTTATDLAQVVRKAVADALAEAKGASTSPEPARLTWAAVASRASSTQTATQAKVVPNRQDREIIVRTKEPAPEIASRTAKEIVAAVSKAAGRDGPIAARRLRSGDTVLTFPAGQSEEYNAFLADKSWVTAAFGPNATVSQRTYAVLVKGFPTSVKQVDARQLATDITTQNGTPIIRCHIRRSHPGVARTAVLMEVGSVEAAKTLCDDGLIYNAEIYHAEPYDGTLQPRRCYRCHRFGHTARYCTAQARCGLCAGTAHPDGDVGCPAKENQSMRCCVNCKGNHAAWNSDCPSFLEQKARAATAYAERPLTFAARCNQQQPSTTTDEWTTVQRRGNQQKQSTQATQADNSATITKPDNSSTKTWAVRQGFASANQATEGESKKTTTSTRQRASKQMEIRELLDSASQPTQRKRSWKAQAEDDHVEDCITAAGLNAELRRKAATK